MFGVARRVLAGYKDSTRVSRFQFWAWVDFEGWQLGSPKAQVVIQYLILKL